MEKVFIIKIKIYKTMKLLKEHDEYDLNDIVLIEYLTYYNLEFLTNDWILKTMYISKPQISMQEQWKLYN